MTLSPISHFSLRSHLMKIAAVQSLHCRFKFHPLVVKRHLRKLDRLIHAKMSYNANQLMNKSSSASCEPDYSKTPNNNMKEKKSSRSSALSSNNASLLSWKNLTPTGELKNFKDAMDKEYFPHRVESAWDKWWEAKNLFKPSTDPNSEKYVIVIPPPNVTGTLHLGHALTTSVQDCLIRYHRMNGKNVLWVPGCDHAG